MWLRSHLDGHIAAQQDRLVKQTAELDELKNRFNETLQKVRHYYQLVLFNTEHLNPSLVTKPSVPFNLRGILNNARKTFGMKRLPRIM